MPRNITVTFDDGSSHVYQNAPDNLTPEMVAQRAQTDFNKTVTALDGGRSSGIPISRASSPLTQLGRSAASLGDVAWGMTLPAAVEYVAQPVARMFTSPERSAEIAQTIGGAVSQPFGKAFGVTETPEYKGEITRRVGGLVGEAVGEKVKAIAEKTGLPEQDVAHMVSTGMLALPGAYKGAKAAAKYAWETPEVQTAVRPVTERLEARAEQIAQKRSLKSWERAKEIEAAQLAPKYDIALNPAESNPTVGNRVTSVLSGPEDLNVKLAKRNEAKWVSAAKSAMGLPPEIALGKEAFEAARSQPEIAGPYNAVRGISDVKVPESTFAELDKLRAQPLFGDTGQAAAANAFLDKLKADLTAGGNGGKLLDSIRQLREDAQSIYHAEKAGNPISPEMRAQADAKMGAANALEQAIDASIPDAAARKAFTEARTKMAQTYDFEAATNYATGKLDPQVLARMAKEGKPLTGVVGDLAQIAANFPETSRLGATPEKKLRLSRTGVSGTIGGVLGNFVAPGVGWVPGTAIGGGVGYLSSGIGARRIGSPEYQLQHAVPTDYRRAAPNQLAPQPAPTNALVPYVATGEVLPPEYVPNWVPGRPESVVQPAMPGARNMLGYDPNAPVQGQTRAFEIMRERERELAMRQGMEAEAAQAAAEAAARKPAGAGITLEFDPATGKLREVPATGAQLTPTSALESAVEKLSGKMVGGTETQFQRVAKSAGAQGEPRFYVRGRTTELPATREPQAFAMTAEEKIAWDRAKADLADIAPGMKALTDEAIAQKMSDRKWLESTISNARAKIAAMGRQEQLMMEQLAGRADLAEMAREINAAPGRAAQFQSGAEAARAAATARQRGAAGPATGAERMQAEQLAAFQAERQRLMDLADYLNEALRGTRPVSKATQGPKTRAAIRNQLAGESETKNFLAR